MYRMTNSGTKRPHTYHHGDLSNALVKAGLGLAREGGPDAIVLREAARRVGVSATAAYRHFSSLPELVNAVALACLAELARSMEAELARCDDVDDEEQQAWDRMCAIGRGYVRFALREPGLFAVAFNRTKRTLDPHGGTGDSGLSAKELLERALDDLAAAGVLADSDREGASMLAWASVHGLSQLFLGPMADVPTPEREAIIEETLDLVGRGLMVRG